MEIAKVPTHVAIIMDGNGRWALSRGLPRLAGHRAGVENLRRIITACVEFGVQHLTIYAFSTENWGRPREEVDGLLFILNEVLDRELEELNRQGVQLRHIGRLEVLSSGLQKKVRGAMELTRNNQKLVLNVAFNYGGRDEIVHAIQQMLADGVKAEEVDAELVSRYLFTAGQPDPDLIIRTHPWPFADHEHLSQHAQDGLEPCSDFARTRDHDRERPLLRAHWTAAHRRVDTGDALGGETLRYFDRHPRSGRGEIGERLDPRAGDDAVFPEGNRTHDCWCRQADQHRLGGRGNLCRRLGALRPSCHQWSQRSFARIVDRELVAGVQKPARHVPAHFSDADETENRFSHDRPP